jgi:hypothetical protein
MNVVEVVPMQRCSVDFVVFRVLRDSIPLTDEAYERVRMIIDEVMRRSGKPMEAAERTLALYKLRMEKETMREPYG